MSNTIWKSQLSAGRDIMINTHNHGGPIQDPLKVLQKRAALGALHDSAERFDAPKCHPETREAVLERINHWAKDYSDNTKPILWLTGAAGAGKTAIAQTLVETWKEEGLIVPNFFCWRTSPERNTKTHLIPTLSFQLMKSLPAVKAKMQEAVEDESIFGHSLKSQVKGLITDPLEDLRTNERLVVIVLDGLDEVCRDLPKHEGFSGQNYEEQQQEILEAMAGACQKRPSLRILIASRPERQIRTSFAELPLDAISHVVSLIDEPNASADITLYLDCKFAEIRRRNPGIDPSWPSPKQITLLVEKSSGQFIYPSIVVKHISQGRQFPVKSLEEVLALQARSDSKNYPLAQLDALHRLVLRSVAPESWPIVRVILGLMCYDLFGPLPNFQGVQPAITFLYLSKLLFISSGELSYHLADLHSLLSIPGPSQCTWESEPIHFMHATLSEYLTDESRSSSLSITERDVHIESSLLLARRLRSKRHKDFAWLSILSYELSRLDAYIALGAFVVNSEPSADLMKELWNLMKNRIGDYSGDVMTILGPDQLATDAELYILQYLQDCNISEIEPSKSHREAIDQRLKALIPHDATPRDNRARMIQNAKATNARIGNPTAVFMGSTATNSQISGPALHVLPVGSTTQATNVPQLWTVNVGNETEPDIARARGTEEPFFPNALPMGSAERTTGMQEFFPRAPSKGHAAKASTTQECFPNTSTIHRTATAEWAQQSFVAHEGKKTVQGRKMRSRGFGILGRLRRWFKRSK